MSIQFTGDVILDRGVKDQMNLHGDSLLISALQKVVSEDFLVVNYEGTFTNTDDHQNDVFNFNVSHKKAALLSEGGVTHVSVANNHSYDYKEKGFKDTIEALKENNIITLGNECSPQILKKGKYSCAVLAASLTTHNDKLCISSVRELKNSVKKFSKEEPLLPLIVYIHWGLELQSTPERWQRELAKELVDAGVDAIIGHHPHVVQTIEFIEDVPVFYSLGNYIADAYLPNTDFSYTIRFSIKDKIEEIYLTPIQIKRYFPFNLNKEEQHVQIKKFLSFSDKVCALEMQDDWLLKPLSKVDFKENTSLWIASADTILSMVKRMKTGTHVIKLETPDNASNTVRLHGDLSEMQFSDINNDGVIDLLLGISKKVNFDPVYRKRINIYSYQNKSLKPLWLGTKFIDDVQNFDTYSNQDFNYLSTIEIDKKGKRYYRTYEWDDFGFGLITNQANSHEN
ncbi:CapA family protein [Aquimarina pacifica]|uniref:CapA family protein n=1 Tax=Aquimarina pacifica TaxID=1296415 RepID=UPI0004718C63|nr:CapA family protein [Aquimarina pacifica]